MDKRLFVIAIAVGAALISTLFQVFMQGRHMNSKAKRLLWVGLATGVAALVVLGAIVLSR